MSRARDLVAPPSDAAHDDNALWIRRFHPRQNHDARLVFLPHAGGSANYYFSFSKALSAHLEVLAVQYPGRQDRWAEECIDAIPELAAEIHAALLPWLDRPLALFGHSMGATIAFEVARRLEHDSGFVPASLFVSARPAPAHHRDLGVHLLDDEGIVEHLHALDGTDAGLLADRDLLELILPAVRSDYRAVDTYVYAPGPPLSCPIVALIGDADPGTDVIEAAAWREYTTGPFDLRVFPGGHFYLAGERANVEAAIVRHRAKAP